MRRFSDYSASSRSLRNFGWFLPPRGRCIDDAMAWITAERLMQHLEASGFVLMKGAPRVAPTTSRMPPGQGPDAAEKENPTAEAAGELSKLAQEAGLPPGRSWRRRSSSHPRQDCPGRCPIR